MKAQLRYGRFVDPRLRRVVRLPLEELWNEKGAVAATRGPYVTAEAVRDLLRAGPVQFVEAALGELLRWVPLGERFDFWKGELRERVVETPERFHLDDYPGGFCYLVSRWNVPSQPYPVLVAEMYH